MLENVQPKRKRRKLEGVVYNVLAGMCRVWPAAAAPCVTKI